MASLSPKYFFATFSVIIIEFISERAFSLSPLINGKSNILKKESSVKQTLLSLNTFELNFTVIFASVQQVAFSISGKLVDNSFASGKDV